MKTQIKFIPKTEMGYKIWKANYCKKTADLAVMEANFILDNI
jgi:hypothetical protein